MTSMIVSAVLALTLGTTGQFAQSTRVHRAMARILPPGPGNGWGFPNGNPDGYGWYEQGNYFVMGADRTGEYFFNRLYSVPVDQMFMSSYYNPYVVAGQRYIPYSRCGGAHPMGGPPLASAALSVHPYSETIGSGPRVQIPPFTGRVEAPPINTGNTGLTP